MKNNKQFLRSAGVFFMAGTLVFLAGCGGDDEATQKKHDLSFDHAHGSDVSDLKKHQFEHKFAEQCVARELKNSVNKDEDRKRYEKDCLCIATRMMKDLSAEDAEKFLDENKNTQSMRMSFDEAAYFCLQKNQPSHIKGPKLFGR
jgi:hypothetical protein